MANSIYSARSPHAGLVQRTRIVLVGLALAISVSFLAASAWLYPTRLAPWNSIGLPIESVHVPDNVLDLTKRGVRVEGTSPMSLEAYNVLRFVQWALLLAFLAMFALCVLCANYECLIYSFMSLGVVGIVIVPLLSLPTVEGLLSQRVEALDGPGTTMILQAVGASDDDQAYVQAQIAVLSMRKAKQHLSALSTDSLRSIVQRAGTKFRDTGRAGMSADVLHRMERELFGRALSPPAHQYERQQLARAEYYARRPPVFQIVALGGAGLAVTLTCLALSMNSRYRRIAGLLKRVDLAYSI